MPLDVDRIQAICFDVDGTLSDTDDLWVSNFARRFSFLKFLTPQKDMRAVGRWLVMALETPGNLVYEVLDRLHLDDDVANVFNWIAHHNPGRRPKYFWMVPHGMELIEFCYQRYPLSIVTARDDKSTRAFLMQFNIENYFKSIVTSQTCTYTKPFPDPILKAAREKGIAPENCLMVGDTTVDMRAGKAAGAQTVGVLSGFGTERELRRVGADLILNDTYELMAVLK
ncbi:MAG TPA: HAD family hydrolase [Anaerolineaceae bacterium]|nr:HAD family hydrolase [Anaerolineaceae bacterium]